MSQEQVAAAVEQEISQLFLAQLVLVVLVEAVMEQKVVVVALEQLILAAAVAALEDCQVQEIL
tara:strand:- start:192 stop:380 length:189 start_codon:yes stop_codon:yes gene_type:complete